jgi:hypothetical protein
MQAFRWKSLSSLDGSERTFWDRVRTPGRQFSAFPPDACRLSSHRFRYSYDSIYGFAAPDRGIFGTTVLVDILAVYLVRLRLEAYYLRRGSFFSGNVWITRLRSIETTTTKKRNLARRANPPLEPIARLALDNSFCDNGLAVSRYAV